MDESEFSAAVRCKSAVAGLTHNFYRYPARFSPEFVAAAIRSFSRSGDLVLDPFMGGGSTIVEAVVHDRSVVGSDINALSTFLARVKTTPLSKSDVNEVLTWSNRLPSLMNYQRSGIEITRVLDDQRTKNLHVPRARAIKKGIAIALTALSSLKSPRARAFARCVLLRSGQWAFDGRRSVATMDEFKSVVDSNTNSMVASIQAFRNASSAFRKNRRSKVLLNLSASQISESNFFRDSGREADLVITSPPYPGIHVLYHRWQVDGRRETPAPYWVADCADGHGPSFYSFGNRNEPGLKQYFETLKSAMQGVRAVTKKGGVVIQLVGFSQPHVQLPRYLDVMRQCGFDEDFKALNGSRRHRLWRDVPNRKWHAALKGQTHSAREVVLIHRAL